MTGRDIKIGDYVEYVPDLEKCVVHSSYSGHKEDQFFFPSRTKFWRVFELGEEVKLMPVKSVGSLTLHGFEGYDHAEDLLNYISQAYVNVRYATRGRSLGSQKEPIPVSRFITVCVGEKKKAEKSFDGFDPKDVDRLNEYGLMPKKGSIWLAVKFRYLDLDEGEEYCNCHFVNCSEGNIGGACLQYLHCDEYRKTYLQVKGVFPIVYLRPEVRFEGKGTIRSPYKIVV